MVEIPTYSSYVFQVDLVLDVERIFPRFYGRYYIVEEKICTKTQDEAAEFLKPEEQVRSFHVFGQLGLKDLVQSFLKCSFNWLNVY